MKKDLAAERREVTDVYDLVRFEVRNAQWNLPIVLTSCIAAFTVATWKYIVAVGSLYQNNDFMEADWLPESLSLSASIPYQLLAEYGHAAEAWPLLTMASTSGIAYIVGDVVAQRIEGRWRVGLLDLARTARAGALGFFLHGPLLSAWIRLLETTLFAGGAGDWSTLVAKIALDQTLFAATINLLYAFINALLNDKAPSEAAESARSLLVPSMLSSWRFWPAVHLISYSPLIPLDYKLLWIDVMRSYGWPSCPLWSTSSPRRVIVPLSLGARDGSLTRAKDARCLWRTTRTSASKVEERCCYGLLVC